MKRFPLILALLALVLWVYFNNRQVEMYNPELEKLLGYIMGDDFKPKKFKEMMSEMTDDKESILIAYTLAKQGQYDELAFFVEDFFGAPKIPTTSVSDFKKSS
tara:strand:- start:150 stop:458 length:309 start_codon:yes stop_codon:yes gene_type:complete